MRLIDANALKKENERLLHCDFPYLSETTLEELIDEAPTIDAEPVRHGEWIRNVDPLGFFESIPVCSVCGCTTTYREIYRYCPHCGARMDERKEE